MESCTNDKDTTTANSFHPKLVPLLVSMFFMLFNIILVSSFSYSGIITSLAKLRPVRTANEKSRKQLWSSRETYCLHYVQICIISVCVKYWKSWKLNFATNWTQPSLQNYTECSKRSSGRQSDLCRQLCNWCYWSERIELNSIKVDQFKVFSKAVCCNLFLLCTATSRCPFLVVTWDFWVVPYFKAAFNVVKVTIIFHNLVVHSTREE